MQQADFLINIAQFYGLPSLFFIIWFIYHDSQTKTFKSIIDQNFKLLGGLLESVQYQSAMLTKIAEQIQTNQFCPLMRKDFQRFNINEKGE